MFVVLMVPFPYLSNKDRLRHVVGGSLLSGKGRARWRSKAADPLAAAEGYAVAATMVSLVV